MVERKERVLTKTRRRVRQSLSERTFDVVNIVLLLAVMAIIAFPLYYMAVVSLSNGKEVMQGHVVFWPKGFTLESYKAVLANPAIPRAFLNSFLYTGVGTLVSIVMTTLCAYPLSRRTFYGRGFFSKLVVITMFFNGGLVPTYLVVLNLKLIDTIWAMVLPTAINTYYMIVMRTFFAGIHEAIFESAQIDGASEFTILRKIVLPVSGPIMATMLLYYVVLQWNGFLNALLYINSKVRYPIQILLRNLVVAGDMSEQASIAGSSSGFVVTDLTLKYAFVTLAFLPILLVYPFVQRHFVKGVMLGSVKG